MSETTSTVSANLRAVMAIRKLTIGALARELGVTRQTAGLYYGGLKPMTGDQIAAAARWLGVSVGDLFMQEPYELAAA